MSDFDKIDRILPDLRRRADNPPLNSIAQKKVLDCLNEIFGQSAQFLEPLLFSSGQLMIYVTAPIWTTHIRHRQTTLTGLLSKKGLHVTDIRVKVVPQSADDKQVSHSLQADIQRPELSPGTLNTISLTGLSVKNPKLQSALQRLRSRLIEK